MNEEIFNDAVTMAGGERTLLAGRYRIVRQLGQGGMGSVWLAEDTQLDDKLFAIKMLPSILIANKRAFAQLKAEALTAMKLAHPNIVTLRAFEENNGNPFLVMDYVEGQTLDECLREWGTLTEDRTTTLLKPIASALDYAHAKGIIHRDVKPGNILVSNDGTPYVLDFGIAREMQEPLTKTGKLSCGTLLYMSPEQLRGESPTAAQDVYSFAAMAYECLAGKPPFSRAQIEYQILNEDPELLPIDMCLSQSVMAGLEKDPDLRPKSCISVLEGVATSPEDSCWIVEESPKRRIRGTFAVILILTVAFAALFAGGWWVWSAYDADIKNQISVIQKSAENKLALLKAEKERLEADKRKLEEDRVKAEKKQALELAAELAKREEEQRRQAELTRQMNELLAKMSVDQAKAYLGQKHGDEMVPKLPYCFELSDTDTEFTTYIVQRGDTLSTISRKLGVKVADIKAANPQINSKDAVHIGQQLKIPGKHEVGERKLPENAFVKPVANGSYNGETVDYVVKSGDTIGKIAYGHGINIRQLKELNGLISNNVRFGQKLKVPSGKAAPNVEQRKETDHAKMLAAKTLESVEIDSADCVSYQVQEGDDIISLSIRFGLPWSEICELNNLGMKDELKKGQIIKLPAGTSL